MPVLWIMIIVIGAIAVSFLVKALYGVALALFGLLLFPLALAEDLKWDKKKKEMRDKIQKMLDDDEREMNEHHKRMYWGDDE